MLRYIILFAFITLTGCGSLPARSDKMTVNNNADIDGEYLCYMQNEKIDHSISAVKNLAPSPISDTAIKATLSLKRKGESIITMKIIGDGISLAGEYDAINNNGEWIIEKWLYFRSYFPIYYVFDKKSVGFSVDNNNDLCVRTNGIGFGGVLFITGGYPNQLNVFTLKRK